MMKRIYELLRMNIHRLVLAGSWEQKILGYDVSLRPVCTGRDEYWLVLFLNNHQQPKRWRIYSREYRGCVDRIKPKDLFFLVGDSGTRFRYLYIDTETGHVGTSDQFWSNAYQQYGSYRKRKDDFKSQVEAMKQELFGTKDAFQREYEKREKLSRLKRL